MPIVGPKFKKDIEDAIVKGLTNAFAKEAGADPSSHAKLAKGISEIADVIVSMLTTDAQVTPGTIITAGSPATQTSTSPGKIS